MCTGSRGPFDCVVVIKSGYSYTKRGESWLQIDDMSEVESCAQGLSKATCIF